METTLEEIALSADDISHRCAVLAEDMNYHTDEFEKSAIELIQQLCADIRKSNQVEAHKFETLNGKLSHAQRSLRSNIQTLAQLNRLFSNFEIPGCSIGFYSTNEQQLRAGSSVSANQNFAVDEPTSMKYNDTCSRDVA